MAKHGAGNAGVALCSKPIKAEKYVSAKRKADTVKAVVSGRKKSKKEMSDGKGKHL
jgi:hypothetical protein